MTAKTETDSWVKKIGAITLFVEDLAATKEFYTSAFRMTPLFEDAASTVFDFGSTVINLLHTPASAELIVPAVAAGPQAGSRFVITVEVDDVDAACTELIKLGVTLLNGSVDRPWGIRSACFRDRGMSAERHLGLR